MVDRYLDETIRAAHAYVKRQDWVAAFETLNAVLNEDPDRPEALYLMGSTLRELGHLGLAYQALRRALAGDQKQPNLWMIYAATLHDLNRYEEAREGLQIVHKMLPSDPMPPANIGATYVQTGQWREALEWCDKALKLDPDNHIARISANFAHLSLGRWRDAWADARYMYGKHLPLRVYNPPEHEEPMWDGTKGQVVVVQADQGVGDILMFAQCLPQLMADSREVILECSPRLARLMRRNFPGLVVEPTLKDLKQSWALERLGGAGEVQAHVHISYLGNWYRNSDADFPRQAYLTAHEEYVAKWRERLAPYPRPWVGIAGRGGIQATQTNIRSIDLADFGPIIKATGAAGGTAIDLSYQDWRLELSRWNIANREQVRWPNLNNEDMDDVLALVSVMDEVVTVTTTVAHMRGAMGQHAYVLVPQIAQWRYAYRLADDSMIWYPKDSVKLYRQKPGEKDWQHAIARVARDFGNRITRVEQAAAA